MKKTYKLLGYLLLGIGAYAVFNANNTNLQATSPVTPISWQAQGNRILMVLTNCRLHE